MSYPTVIDIGDVLTLNGVWMNGRRLRNDEYRIVHEGGMLRRTLGKASLHVLVASATGDEIKISYTSERKST